MSKTKIAIMDDSQPQVEEKKHSNKKNKNQATEMKSDADSSDVIASEQSETKQSTKDENPTQIAAESETPRNDKPAHPSDGGKKTQKPGKQKPRSKKYQEVTEELDRTLTYSLNEAIDLVKKLSYSKFIGTLEAHINTNQSGIRGLVSLPFSTGKKLTILAFGPTSSKDFEGSEDVIIGTDEVIDEINKGKINFDLIVTSPDWMSKLAKVARILGPRGLMPNPKSGTIVNPSADGLKKAVEGFQSGKTEYKTEPKASVIHLGLGKLTQPTEELSANIKTLLQTLGKSRVKKVSLSPTMGPSVKLDLTSI